MRGRAECIPSAGAGGPVPALAALGSASSWPTPGKNGARSPSGPVVHANRKRRLRLPTAHSPFWP
eukprot:1182340-Alexandrium_andersonii.AAC.1